MGFASKLEDEIERRGGDAPRSISIRLAYVFGAYGVTADPPGRQSILRFDEEAEKKLGEILGRLEQAHQRKAKAFESIPSAGVRGVGKALSAHTKFASDIDALILFLAPFVRQMHGDQRRSWNRKIEQLKKAQYL